MSLTVFIIVNLFVAAFTAADIIGYTFTDYHFRRKYGWKRLIPGSGIYLYFKQP